MGHTDARRRIRARSGQGHEAGLAPRDPVVGPQERRSHVDDERRRQAPVLLPSAVDGVRPGSTSASRVARAPRSYSEVKAAR